VYLLKQIILYHVNKTTAMFSAFLDAFEAFDRTNHIYILQNWLSET